MSGDTHAAVALAVTTSLLPTMSVEEQTFALALVAFGAILPDVDQTNKRTKKMVMTALVVLGLLVTGTSGVIKTLNPTAMLGLALLAVWIVIGYTRPHRELTHSFVAASIATVAVAMITFSTRVSDVAALYTLNFGLAMLSHDLIDTLNGKRVHLLWPSPGGVCFNVMAASGIGNNLVKYMSLLIVAINFVV